MAKSTITKIAIGTGIGALAGAITYKMVKDHKEKKAMEKILNEKEYIFEEEDYQDIQLLNDENIVPKRKYIKI